MPVCIFIQARKRDKINQQGKYNLFQYAIITRD